MKRMFSKLFLIAIVFVMIFNVAACAGDNDNAGNESAYQTWLNNGNSGTEADFLNSLKGESAYQIWLNNGNSGTEADFLNWLKITSEPELGTYENPIIVTIDEYYDNIYGYNNPDRLLKYYGKIVQITGVLSSISTTNSNHLRIRNENNTKGVTCHFFDSLPSSDMLNKEITVIGVNGYYPFAYTSVSTTYVTNFYMANCHIVETA